MAMKGYSAFPKALATLDPHDQIVYYHIQDTRWVSYPSAEVQSEYSTAPVDWARERKNRKKLKNTNFYNFIV